MIYTTNTNEMQTPWGLLSVIGPSAQSQAAHVLDVAADAFRMSSCHLHVDGSQVVAHAPPDPAGGVLWEVQTGRVRIRRGPMGGDPVYWTRHCEAFCVSTCLQALRTLVGLADAAAAAVRTYLVFNYPMEDRGFYHKIHALPPGREMQVVAGKGAPAVSITGNDRLPDAEALATERSYRDRLHGELDRCCQPAHAPAFHLSGGIDSSLLCHLAADLDSASPLRAYTAHYGFEHPDRLYSARVAREVRASLQTVTIDPSNLPQHVDTLIRLFGTPVMASGMLTFWELARAARADGVDRIVTGIGGDHPFTGARKTRKGTSSDALFSACATIPPAVLRPFLADPEADNRILEQVRNHALHRFPDAPPAVAVERFYTRNFLQEHLRQTNLVHRHWGIVACHPFLHPGVAAAGLAEGQRMPDRAADKGFLRALLQTFHSQAARRTAKRQMALTPRQFRAAFREALLHEFAEPVVDGLNYSALRALARGTGPLDKPRARLLWAVYNLHRWVALCPVSAPLLDVD